MRAYRCRVFGKSETKILLLSQQYNNVYFIKYLYRYISVAYRGVLLATIARARLCARFREHTGFFLFFFFFMRLRESNRARPIFFSPQTRVFFFFFVAR